MTMSGGVVDGAYGVEECLADLADALAALLSGLLLGGALVGDGA
ncbi:hypothetical protein [Thermostaphylospora chromogena]|nr:hypothetical protein [Thermostaphylospora chromogena]